MYISPPHSFDLCIFTVLTDTHFIMSQEARKGIILYYWETSTNTPPVSPLWWQTWQCSHISSWLNVVYIDFNFLIHLLHKDEWYLMFTACHYSLYTVGMELKMDAMVGRFLRSELVSLELSYITFLGYQCSFVGVMTSNKTSTLCASQRFSS